MDNLDRLNTLFNNFFKKQTTKTSHETLATYDDGSLISGGENGSFYTHINYYTMKTVLEKLLESSKSSYIFAETGCAAHGTKSTLLWDKFVNIFGGKVFSVDLNKGAVDETNNLTSDKTIVTCSDSLLYLPILTEPIDFLYLDSYDVDFLDPLPSAEHHLKEFNAVKHLLHKGSIILIDDTPISRDWFDDAKNSHLYHTMKDTFNPEMSGKGSLVIKELEKMGATKIMHQYQTLWVL